MSKAIYFKIKEIKSNTFTPNFFLVFYIVWTSTTCFVEQLVIIIGYSFSAFQPLT